MKTWWNQVVLFWNEKILFIFFAIFLNDWVPSKLNSILRKELCKHLKILYRFFSAVPSPLPNIYHLFKKGKYLRKTRLLESSVWLFYNKTPEVGLLQIFFQLDTHILRFKTLYGAVRKRPFLIPPPPCRNFYSDLSNFYLLISCNIVISDPTPP